MLQSFHHQKKQQQLLFAVPPPLLSTLEHDGKVGDDGGDQLQQQQQQQQQLEAFKSGKNKSENKGTYTRNKSTGEDEGVENRQADDGVRNALHKERRLQKRTKLEINKNLAVFSLPLLPEAEHSPAARQTCSRRALRSTARATWW